MSPASLPLPLRTHVSTNVTTQRLPAHVLDLISPACPFPRGRCSVVQKSRPGFPRRLFLSRALSSGRANLGASEKEENECLFSRENLRDLTISPRTQAWPTPSKDTLSSTASPFPNRPPLLSQCRHTQPQSIPSHVLTLALALGASLPLILGASPAISETTAPSGLQTPYTQSEQANELGLVDGRIRPCPTAFNPNCISTSSLNRSYGEPWIIPPASTQNAVRKIENAIMSTVKGAEIKVSTESDSGAYYILAEVDGVFGRDTMEFLVKEDEGLVLYRSMAGKVVYIYPFTTPITDLDAQRKRMKGLEEELGWAQVAGACDYGVCSVYEDAEEDETIRREPRVLPLGFTF